MDRMMADILALRWLKQENIVRMLNTVTIPDSRTHFPFSTVLLLMELCDGTVAEICRLCRTGVPEQVCKKWMRDTVHGLEYLHNLNICHLDIKTDNILFQWDDPETDLNLEELMNNYQTMTFKLGDFGEMQSFGFDGQPLTTEFSGTVGFRSPEMERLRSFAAQKESPGIDAKASDVFSLGATLVRCLMTNNEFEDKRNDPGLGAMIANVKSGADTLQGYSDKLIDLLNDLLRTDPTLRPTIDRVLAYEWFEGEEEVEDEEDNNEEEDEENQNGDNNGNDEQKEDSLERKRDENDNQIESEEKIKLKH